jgi:hypothetical protein
LRLAGTDLEQCRYGERKNDKEAHLFFLREVPGANSLVATPFQEIDARASQALATSDTSPGHTAGPAPNGTPRVGR